MSRQIHILALFDYNSITGFSTVSNNLVNTWKTYFGDDLHMDIVAINYFGEDYSDGKNIRFERVEIIWSNQNIKGSFGTLFFYYDIYLYDQENNKINGIGICGNC